VGERKSVCAQDTRRDTLAHSHSHENIGTETEIETETETETRSCV